MVRPAPAAELDPLWWRTAVVYQVYPRSFADSDGDGIGNLAGITSRVPYLSDLGVDAVWLSPFYPSGLADGGYDVDDYRDVDPRIGDLDDFEEMVSGLHAAGIRVIVDIVPNHTSDRHEWFREALAGAAGSAARQRYIFRDGIGPDGAEPPNDWESCFGGSAWERVPDGQYYLHLFAKEQPDLNWDHAQVRADFLTTLRFWSDRGVDGFRVDVAHGLVKDLSEPFEPWSTVSQFPRPDGSHPLWDRDTVTDIYATWRAVFNEYVPPRFAVAEAAVMPRRRRRYAMPEGLGQAFNFSMQEAYWDIGEYRTMIDQGLADIRETGSSTTWLLGCHDTVRVATRYGLAAQQGRTSREVFRDWLRTDGRHPPEDQVAGTRRARAAALVLLALPGSAYIYQGEELGLPEVGDLPSDALQDPLAERSGGREKGRDGCRIPLPWTATGTSFGFGSGGAHLPQPRWYARYAVDVEQADPSSTLALYRHCIRLRRSLHTQTEEGLIWHDADEGILHFERPGGWHCVVNFSDLPFVLPAGEILACSVPLVGADGDRLPPDSAVWIRAGR